ncbi:MAG: response regulator [Bacteroidota bacterium]|nr:response regulator [Bacteroidota bacterium]
MAERQRFRIAVIDSDPLTIHLLERALGSGPGHRLAAYADGTALLAESGREAPAESPHAILLGLEAEGIAPLSTFARIRSAFPGVPVIILTDAATQEVAEEGLRRGAADYFTRPLDLRRLRYVLPRIIEDALCRRNTAAEDGGAMSMDAARERAVRRALTHAKGNIREAARLLGIGRTTIYKLMERYAIDRDGTLEKPV